MTKDKMTEAFASKLLKIKRKLTKRTPSGGSAKSDQVMHVKNPQAGDEFHPPEARDAAAAQKASKAVKQGRPIKDPVRPVEPLQVHPDEAGNRIGVGANPIPWSAPEDKADPIPKEIRAKYDNKKVTKMYPSSGAVNTSPLEPTNATLWGTVEADLVDKLRSGRLISAKMAASFDINGYMLVKIECPDSTVYSAIMKMEYLYNRYLYQRFGHVYSLKKETADISKRDAAAYEVSKVIGLDCLVPPTVVREDYSGTLDPILDKSLIESREAHFESIADRVGKTKDQVRTELGGISAVTLFPRVSTVLPDLDWFRRLFSEEGDAPEDGLNNFWSLMPPEQREALLKIAILDYILWIGDRNLSSVVIGTKPEQIMMVPDNGISLPDPRIVADHYSRNAGPYIGGQMVPGDAYPLLWSDIVILMAARGGVNEINDYARLASDVAGRINESRCNEMVHALLGHGIDQIVIAGLLLRIYALISHARYLARDPFLIAKLYLSLRTKTPIEGPTPGVSIVDELAAAVEKTNKIMGNATGSDFDLQSEMAK
jgi:hypothetical protein